MADAHEHMAIAGEFDREFAFHELLSGVDAGRLAAVLSVMLGMRVRLVDCAGAVLGGDPDAVTRYRIPVTHEIETVGYLETEHDPGEHGPASAAIVEMLVMCTARYLMASGLHLQTVQADYEELQRRHEALRASEAEYRTLAEHLEQRVEEQVATIDAARRRLYQSEKMASVGQLAAGVAHEINNPIGFIRSNLDTARDYVRHLADIGKQMGSSAAGEPRAMWSERGTDEMLEDFATLLSECTGGVDRIASIVRDLKGFSNVDGAEEEVIDLNDCVRRVCNVARSRIAGQTVLVFEAGALPPVRCRPGHISQALLNLVINAAQAVGECGRITVATLSTENGRILVDVSDDGEGIPEETRERIFDPFFTTREAGQGTGLGLTVTRDIVQSHGGEVRVESEPGTGTRVSVSLPA